MTKTRVCISHDGWLGSADKHDVQSLILELMFQDRIDIQGIASTSSRWGDTQRTSNTHKILDVYVKDWAKLDAKTDASRRHPSSRRSAVRAPPRSLPRPASGSSPAAASPLAQCMTRRRKQNHAVGRDCISCLRRDVLGACVTRAERSGQRRLSSLRCAGGTSHRQFAGTAGPVARLERKTGTSVPASAAPALRSPPHGGRDGRPLAPDDGSRCESAGLSQHRRRSTRAGVERGRIAAARNVGTAGADDEAHGDRP